MHLRQSLLLSSQGSATYNMCTIPGYLLHVAIKEVEYTPYIPMTPGPSYRTLYTLTITRDDSSKKADEPHFEQEFSDVDTLEEFLQAWRIDIEEMWSPDEPDVEPVARLQPLHLGK